MENEIKSILIKIGEDPEREGLKETPKRVSRMYKEIFYGLTTPAPEFKKFKSENNQMITKTFKGFSWCEHHLVPIEMDIKFGYIPNGYVTGISKIIRRIEWWMARPVIQENLTESIIKDFMKEMNPKGVILIMKGRHFCELIRGVRKDSNTITSGISGVFKTDFTAKDEFLKLMNL